MTVLINELGMAQYFNSTIGPWGRHLGRIADTVRDSAISNAQGPIIDVDTSDLISNTRIQLDGRPTGCEAQVGSTAEHRGANYPAFVTRATFATPGGWLIQALRDHFQIIRRRDGVA